MPSNVARFEILFYLSLLLSVPKVLLDANHMTGLLGLAFMSVILLFACAIWILLLWLAARRRMNWARWVLLVFFLVGLVPFLLNLVDIFGTSMLSGSLGTLQLAMQSVALYLAFTGNSRPWFAKQPVA